MILAILRSTLYMLLQVIITPPYALITLACFPLSPHHRYRITSSWTLIMLFLLRNLCGLRYQIIGAENIPKTPSIVLSKHQSAWETLAFQKIFPPQVWVLKKELLRIPFFGWGLAMTSPIAIDRKSGKKPWSRSLNKAKIVCSKDSGSSCFLRAHASHRDNEANTGSAAHGWPPTRMCPWYLWRIMQVSSGAGILSLNHPAPSPSVSVNPSTPQAWKRVN